MLRTNIFGLLFCLLLGIVAAAQPKGRHSVIGYYAGPAALLDSFPVQKLTHIIYSFGHLYGNRLGFGSAGDTACIQKMVACKQRYPHLKVILSLGGWGGCFNCSAVFENAGNRTAFAVSVKEALDYFKADGIDLDWEYPAIAGHPGHPYAAMDKHNFTALVQRLRQVLGPRPEISFAAGGFDAFIDSSIDWKPVMKVVNKVNLMSYDLVHGASTTSGHHTPLYATPQQPASTHRAVNRMLAKGVPANKIVIGAAFYARFFRTADTLGRGLYRPTTFYHGVPYRNLPDSLANGFTQYWDAVAHALWAFHPQRQVLATYDDARSIRLKTEYVRKRKLNGIMFWQLADDGYHHGLLDVIYKAMRK